MNKYMLYLLYISTVVMLWIVMSWKYVLIFALLVIAFEFGQVVGGMAVYHMFMCGHLTQPLVNPGFNIMKC